MTLPLPWGCSADMSVLGMVAGTRQASDPSCVNTREPPPQRDESAAAMVTAALLSSEDGFVPSVWGHLVSCSLGDTQLVFLVALASPSPRIACL